MSARFAILCPGQGGQHPAMFDFLGLGDRTSRLLQAWQVEETLGMPLATVLGAPNLAFANRVAQPLVAAATLAAWDAVKAVLPPASVVAGYSVGELSAYAVAGALAPDEALALATVRAALMDACRRASPPQGMLAISGIAPGRLDMLLAACRLSPAIATGADTVIAGGLRDDLVSAEKTVAAEGGRAVLLPIEIASHTPLMQPAVEPWLEALRGSAFSDPVVPVVAGISGELIRDADSAKAVLARQICEPVRWQACMHACAEAGVRFVLELGPGGALSRMFQQQHPGIECRSLQDFRSLAGLEKWVERQLAH